MSLSLLIASGIMSFIAAYVLFKLARENKDNASSDDVDSVREGFNNALQILMFFLLISSLLMVGKTAFAEKDYCAITVANETITGNTTFYQYEYFCESNDTDSGVWVYLLPLWIIRFSGGALLIYLFILIWRAFNNYIRRGGEYG